MSGCQPAGGASASPGRSWTHSGSQLLLGAAPARELGALPGQRRLGAGVAQLDHHAGGRVLLAEHRADDPAQLGAQVAEHDALEVLGLLGGVGLEPPAQPFELARDRVGVVVLEDPLFLVAQLEVDLLADELEGEAHAPGARPGLDLGRLLVGRCRVEDRLLGLLHELVDDQRLVGLHLLLDLGRVGHRGVDDHLHVEVAAAAQVLDLGRDLGREEQVAALGLAAEVLEDLAPVAVDDDGRRRGRHRDQQVLADRERRRPAVQGRPHQLGRDHAEQAAVGVLAAGGRAGALPVELHVPRARARARGCGGHARGGSRAG